MLGQEEKKQTAGQMSGRILACAERCTVRLGTKTLHTTIGFMWTAIGIERNGVQVYKQ